GRSVSAFLLIPASFCYSRARRKAAISPATFPLKTPDPFYSHNPALPSPLIHPVVQRRNFHCPVHSTRSVDSDLDASPASTGSCCCLEHREYSWLRPQTPSH